MATPEEGHYKKKKKKKVPLTLSMWNMRSSSQTFSKHLSSVSTNTYNEEDVNIMFIKHLHVAKSEPSNVVMNSMLTIIIWNYIYIWVI